MADFDPSYLTSVKFSTYSYEKVNKLCVKKITNFSTLDDVGIPVPNGLSDPAMGSFDADEICTTCSLNGYECPGHFGMIDLALPVYNPMFFASLVSLLKGSCFICHKPYAKSVLIQKFILQIKLIDSDLISASRELDSNYSKWNSMVKGYLLLNKTNFWNQKWINFMLDKLEMHSKTKIHAKSKMPRASLKHEFCTMICVKILNTKNVNFQNIDPQLTQHATIKLDAESLSSPQHLTAIDVMHHFNQFSNHENKFLSTLYGHSDSKLLVHMFFLESVCVIPPKFRPVSFMGDSKFENATTGTYKKIIMNKILLENTLSELSNDSTSVSSFKYKGFRKRDLQGAFSRGSSKYERLQSVWSGLQTSINVLFDSKLSRNPKEDSIGLRQLLEKKEGLFRMNMMGKRVNQAARSVISPDPMLDVDEVGVPLVFATKLTYPEYLTSYNSQNMMTYVSNGPNLHPGASHVEFGRSKAILNATNSQRNYAICKRILSQDSVENTKIRRHLLNGDVVLMNRQPTLHRPSIMGHRVRILPKGRTIRLHYANCKSYNADFDGDEMNAHFPQNEIGRSEGYNISSCANHFLSPKDGKPLTGLIQDYMVSGFMMTVRDRFITKQQYQKIIYSSLVETDHLILCLPPAIQKPELLWTGKQIISTLLINCTPHLKDFLNMQGKCKVVEKLWSNCNSCTDVNLSEDNILIRNGELLMGVFDKNQFGASPYGLIHIFYEIYGGHCANKLLSVLGRACIALLQYTGFSMGVHDVVCQPESNVTRENLILESRNSDNKLLQAVFGAENDTELLKDAYRTAHATRQDNILIDLDCQAKNISNDFQNRINQACSSSHLLKTFPSNALQLMIQTGSKGTLVNAMQISGLLGQMELEGRRPPLMISGRTLPCYEPYCSSLQSGGFVESSFLSALKPSEYFFHCMAGREGLIDTAVKTSRSGYLQRCLVKHVEGVKVYYDYSARDSDGSIIQFLYGEDGCDVGSLQFAQDNKFEIFAMNKARLEAFVKPEEALKYIEKDRAPEYQEKVDLDKISFKTGKNNLLPTISLFNPGHYLGSVSENFLAQLLHYTKNDSGNTVVDGKYSSLNWQCNVKTFIKFMLLKYIRCLCPPGEAVGVLSAQSVGEPSTQMTLNTFHFAGRGDVNVTLGIPRLR
ncbi:LOW QUALITY PROTEIN: hypothetical protein MXB_5277 [Myxobolus squamalis]|nr:LOW QUALITY PROTEIN: hypothetical protein MXB_5277 [Myxobolus squamalis]